MLVWFRCEWTERQSAGAEERKAPEQNWATRCPERARDASRRCVLLTGGRSRSRRLRYWKETAREFRPTGPPMGPVEVEGLPRPARSIVQPPPGFETIRPVRSA